MIIAIEGPDGSGKTTIWSALGNKPANEYPRVTPIFADFPSMGKDLWPYAEQVDARDRRLFNSIYDPTKVYVTDRFFAITGPIYARVFERKPPLDVDYWQRITHVIYLAAPTEILLERLGRRQEIPQIMDSFHKVVQAYRDLICSGRFPVSIIPSTSIEETLEQVKRRICSLLLN